MVAALFPRTVRRIEPRSIGDAIDLPEFLLFKDCLHIPNLILLGDPGMGKTFTFKQAAEYEEAEYFTVRSFLRKRGKNCQDKTVYLDALDEFRSRSEDGKLVDELVKVINECGCNRIRLSCRAADWLGGTDLAALKDAFIIEDQFTVVSLEPLSKKEILWILKKKQYLHADAFMLEAEKRNVNQLLSNPQTLLMLVEVVAKGDWPENKKELYEKCTDLLLKESNQAHGRLDVGKFQPDELISMAGMICAILLIANVQSISLLESASGDDSPSYRRIDSDQSDEILACLTRRVFTYIDNESVSYIHRTIAEFLGAKWLAEEVHGKGLPIKRVLSLIGYEDHPASELRGLYAWLVTFLSLDYSYLIDNDPYGVLMYGDAASLAPSGRKKLMESLQLLQERDPWFRANNWSDNPLAALSEKDMIPIFKQILSNPESGFHLRDIVLGALREGDVIPELTSELIYILSDSAAALKEREDVVSILLKTSEGINSVSNIFKDDLIKEKNSSSLRLFILEEAYIKCGFTPNDVANALYDMLSDSIDHGLGAAWKLAEKIPESELPLILDLFFEKDFVDKSDDGRRNHNSVSSVIEDMIYLGISKSGNIPPCKIWHWLLSRNKNEYYSYSEAKHIHEWLGNNRKFVFSLFNCALEEIESYENEIYFYNEFQDSTFHILSADDLVSYILCLIPSIYLKKNKSRILVLNLLVFLIFYRSKTESAILLLDELLRRVDLDAELEEIIAECNYCRIDDWRGKDYRRALRVKEEKNERLRKLVDEINKNLDLISQGISRVYVGFFAYIYESDWYDIVVGKSFDERVAQIVNNDNLPKITQSFINALFNINLPVVDEVIKTTLANSYPSWWKGIIIGMGGYFKIHGVLPNFSFSRLESVFAITTCYPSSFSEIPTWYWEIVEKHPDMVYSTYKTIAYELLNKNTEHNVIIDLLTKNDFFLRKRDFLLDLLVDFPKINDRYLQSIFISLIKDQAKPEDVLSLSSNFVASRETDEGNYILWVLLRFLFEIDGAKDALSILVKKNKKNIWVVISFLKMVGLSLSVVQAYDLIIIISLQAPNADIPMNSGGWSGDQHPWDAADFVRSQINNLAANPTVEAASYLNELLKLPQMESYGSFLKHAIAQQHIIRISANYKQPSFSQTIKTLKNAYPANIADLHALTIDHLHNLKKEILDGSTDKYKAFWRCDSHGRTESPEIEEICRDRLIDFLSPKMPKGLHVEPEGHMADDKRADIIILADGNMKLPLELKRHMHDDVWKACMTQLDRLYTRDPDASGYGIYVVFWFGGKRNTPLATPPDGLSKPNSASEMELQLQQLIPDAKRHYLDVVVIDVTSRV